LNDLGASLRQKLDVIIKRTSRWLNISKKHVKNSSESPLCGKEAISIAIMKVTSFFKGMLTSEDT